MKNFKSLFIASLLLLSFTQSNGQDATKIDLAKNSVLKANFPTVLSNARLRETNPVKRYRKMRNGGIALTALGTAATIAGGLAHQKR